jgi:aminopeptidase
VLTFEDGKLVKWSAEGFPGLVSFFDEQAKEAGKYGDRNWATFAELGIGLNPAIEQLSGNCLFEKKAVRTIHIAIGDNTVFGHV